MEIRGHNLPSISTTILRSCRLIHAESQPFLYRANAFHFDSPHTLHSFRRQTAKHPSVRIQELSLQLGPSDNYHIRTAWERYISAPSEGKKKCLQNDYPHLKRLTIELTGLYKFHGTKHLQKLLESFAQAIAGLDWVHIIGLNDEAIISDLKPMVCTAQPSSSDDKHASSLAREIESVQSHLTEFDRAVGWKNVTLWQGTPRSRPPFIPRPGARQAEEYSNLHGAFIPGHPYPVSSCLYTSFYCYPNESSFSSLHCFI